MIGGLRKGNDFEGLFRYLCHGKGGQEPNRGRILGGTVLGTNQYDLTATFSMIRLLRTDIDLPVRHAWASASEGEHLSDDQWLWIGERLAERMGWDAYVVIQHQGVCEHVHIVGSRIRWDGSVAREVLRDFRIVEQVMREAEVRFRLRRVASPERSDRPHARTQGPRMKGRERDMQRAGKPTVKDLLRKAIQSAEARGLRGAQLIKAVQAQGFQIETKWRNGRPSGVVWTHLASGRKISGSALGPAFKAPVFFRRIGAATGDRNFRGSLARRGSHQRFSIPSTRPRQSKGIGGYRPKYLGAAGSCHWLSRLLYWGWKSLYRAAAGVELDNKGRPVSVMPTRQAQGRHPARKK